MIELSVVRDLVAIFGVIAGVTYYVLTVRNSQRMQKITLETRQAQLFMSLYETARNPEFLKQYYELRYHYEWDDYDGYLKKYDPETNIEGYTTIFSVLGFFEGIDVLLEQELIDLSQVYKLIYPLPNRL